VKFGAEIEQKDSCIAIICEILIVSQQLQTWRRCEFFRFNLTNLRGTESVFKN
jgi:hypothetical protein